MTEARRALFVDRDGVISRLVWYDSSSEWEAPRTLEDLEMVPGAIAALRRLADAGWLLFVITNQPSAAKGKIALASLQEVHAAVMREIAVSGAEVKQDYVCYHHPEGIVPELTRVCDCRKPNPSRLLEAAQEFHLDLASSWMVGDQDTDLRCGRAAGCRVALVEIPQSESKRFGFLPDMRCGSLAEFAERIVRERSQGAEA